MAAILPAVSGYVHQNVAGQVAGGMSGCMNPWTVNGPQAIAGLCDILSNSSDQAHPLYVCTEASVLQGT